MDEHVTFPSSMVDRITPVTSDQDRRDLAERFGVEDAWPVVAEPFAQWVLRGPLRRRPPRSAGRRRAARGRRGAVRADEAAAAQRQPPGARVPRAPRGLPLRARGVRRTRRSRDAAAATWTEEATPTLPPVPGHRPRRLPAHPGERFANPEHRRHPGPQLRGRLRPDPEVRAAGGPARSCAPAGGSGGRPPWRPGRGTSRASTSRASRSTSSTGAGTRVTAARRRAARPTRSRSCATATCSATSSTTSGSPRPTSPRSDSLHEHGARATLESWEKPA